MTIKPAKPAKPACSPQNPQPSSPIQLAELRSQGPRRVWWTCGQLAKRVGLSADTIARYCDDGTLICTRTPGGHRRIPNSVVEPFLRQFKPTG